MNWFRILLLLPLPLFAVDPMINMSNPDFEIQQKAAKNLTDEGDKFLKDNKLKEAKESYNKALVYDPRYAFAHFGIAKILLENHDQENALRELKATVSFDQGLMDGYKEIEKIYLEKNNKNEAFNTYLKAISIDPKFPDTSTSVSVNLRRKDEIEKLKSALSENQLQKKRVYIYADGDLKSTFLLARYLYLFEKTGAVLLFEPPRESASLFKSSLDNVEIVDWLTLEESIHYDFKISLSSLGVVFNVPMDQIPGKEGYLKVSEKAIESDKEWVSKISPRIGIAWNTTKEDESVPLSALVALKDVPKASFYLLQTTDIQLLEHLSKNIDVSVLAESYDSIEEIAGAIANMDRVIAADNSIAMLSLALGKDTTILLADDLDNILFVPWSEKAHVFQKTTTWDNLLKSNAN